MAAARNARVVATAIAAAFALVATFEGNSYTSYRDPAGIPTICRGHTAGVKLGQKATPAQCDTYTKGDLGTAFNAVDRLVKVDVNANELGAYTDFVYNAGSGNFASSTMLKKLNAGDHAGACAELKRWVYANGKVLAGLVKRRAAEYALCMTPEKQ